MQVHAVGADPGGPADLAVVTVSGPEGNPVGHRVHRDHLAFVQHAVDTRRGPPVELFARDDRSSATAHRGRHGAHQPAVVEDADLLGDVVGDGQVCRTDVDGRVRIGLTVEAVAELETEHVEVHVDPGARRVVVLGTPLRDGVADPVPRTLHRRVGAHDHVLLGQDLVGDRLVEMGLDDAGHAIAHVGIGGEPALNFDVGVHIVGGHQGAEIRGPRQRDPAGALAVDRHGVGAGEVQSLGRRPRGAAVADGAFDGVTPVIAQRNTGDLAVDDIHHRLVQRTDVLGPVERRHPEQWRSGPGPRQFRGRRGGRGLATALAPG